MFFYKKGLLRESYQTSALALWPCRTADLRFLFLDFLSRAARPSRRPPTTAGAHEL
jgi:hypothetical protein